MIINFNHFKEYVNRKRRKLKKLYVFRIVFYSSYYNRNNIAILSILLTHIALTLSMRNQIIQYLLVCAKNGTIYNNIDITCVGIIAIIN